MITSKVRSTTTFWHDFPDGSDIKTVCFLNKERIIWHRKSSKDLPDDTEIEVRLVKSVVDSVINTPIGGIPSMRPVERKEFLMTIKQYKEFIVKFWENGYKYYDTL